MSFTHKKTILFDLDGTLTDSGEGIINSIKYALNFYSISGYDEKILNTFIGPPLTESLMENFGFEENKAREAVSIYREYYKEKGLYENKLYEGIVPLLKSLVDNGRQLMVATAKSEVFAVKVLEYFDIAGFFTVIAGSEMEGSRIRKGDVIRYALETAGITDIDSVVMVGDRKHDVIGAKESGIDSIGVLYGYGDREELENAGAMLIVDDIEDLQKALLG